ncbi:MAG: hypothetical protein ABI330_05035 [Caldimonas sp.]
MPIHFIKGVTLAAALLAPVVATLFYHWRIGVESRQQRQVP